jgi:hypothetical protein
MANYEFPDFDYELPAIEGFIDTSWHNDVCPSLTRESPDDESKTLILWCDYADVSKREHGDSVRRFTLVQGEYGNPDAQTTLCESDDLDDILAAIAAHPQPRLDASPSAVQTGETTMKFLVTEKQIQIVTYCVEADNEAMARKHVQAIGAYEYDDVIDLTTEIVAVEEITD